MKQLIHICLSLLLVVATTGLTLHQHYCGEELMQSGLEQHHNCCDDGDAGADEKGDCCNNTATSLGADTDFQSTQFSAAIALLPAALPQIFFSYFESLHRFSTNIAFPSHTEEAPSRYGPAYLASLCLLLI